MELILKQPENKPPCICILFDNSYEASRHNQKLVSQYSMYPFTIKLELQNSKLDLILTVGGLNTSYKYEDLKFAPDKLTRFLFNTKDSKAYNFCHVILKQDKHSVVQTMTNRLLWVLKIDSVEFVEEY